MHGLIARATGQGGGPRVRPAPAHAVAAQGGWGELDESVDAPTARAEPGAPPAIERAAPVGAPRAHDSPPRLQPLAAAPAAPAVPAMQVAEPHDLAAQVTPGRPVPAARRSAAAPVTPPRAITAEPAPRNEPRRPAPLQTPRVTPALHVSHEHTALAAPTVTRGVRRQPAPSAAMAVRETEPVVHVSIGRVELTALVSPPAARPKSPARQPTTSLADYLRAGTGGRK